MHQHSGPNGWPWAGCDGHGSRFACPALRRPCLQQSRVPRSAQAGLAWRGTTRCRSLAPHLNCRRPRRPAPCSLACPHAPLLTFQRATSLPPRLRGQDVADAGPVHRRAVGRQDGAASAAHQDGAGHIQGDTHPGGAGGGAHQHHHAAGGGGGWVGGSLRQLCGCVKPGRKGPAHRVRCSMLHHTRTAWRGSWRLLERWAKERGVKKGA